MATETFAVFLIAARSLTSAAFVFHLLLYNNLLSEEKQLSGVDLGVGTVQTWALISTK